MMSDRRPENPKLWVEKEHGGHAGNVAPELDLVEVSPADLIAAVRRGVESGTIKGERIVLDGASVGKDVPDDLIELVFYMERERGVEWFRRGGDFILIPVSDGGSET